MRLTAWGQESKGVEMRVCSSEIEEKHSCVRKSGMADAKSGGRAGADGEQKVSFGTTPRRRDTHARQWANTFLFALSKKNKNTPAPYKSLLGYRTFGFNWGIA